MTYTVTTDLATYAVEVTCLTVVAGNSNADNPDDYYGYTELEYNVFDEDGNDISDSVTEEEDEEIYEKVLELEMAAAEDYV